MYNVQKDIELIQRPQIYYKSRTKSYQIVLVRNQRSMKITKEMIEAKKEIPFKKKLEKVDCSENLDYDDKDYLLNLTTQKMD